MGRIVGEKRLGACGGGVVARGGERGGERERVARRRLAQRACAAQPPARAAHQSPRQPLHHARVEEIEHARCRTHISNHISIIPRSYNNNNNNLFQEMYSTVLLLTCTN
jgi:hypothetical protein